MLTSTIEMLSDAQIKRIWEGLLGSEIRANYFAELVGRLNREQRISTWLTLLFSSGAAASAFANLPNDYNWIRIVLPVAAAGVSLWSLVKQYPRLATEASDLHFRWNRLANDYERLWENVYADDALSVLNQLDDRAAEASKAGTSFPYEPNVMRKWKDHVVSHRLQAQN